MNIDFIYWNIDPEMINILGFPLRYYGVLFAAGLMLCTVVLKWIFQNENIASYKLDTLIFYGVVGIFIGARLGHCLFYEPSYYLGRPLEIILPIQPTSDGAYLFSGYRGLASHGGAMGLIIALIFYSRKTNESIIKTVDLLAIVAALGSCFIRLGNLMNSEMIGIPSRQPWAFVFAHQDDTPRHPAQLYEAMVYLLIFVFMLFLYRTKREKLQNGFFFGLVLVLIFTARFIIEFVKENQVAFEDGMAINMGQILSLPYILTGIGFMIFGLWKTKKLRSVILQKNGLIKNVHPFSDPASSP